MSLWAFNINFVVFLNRYFNIFDILAKSIIGANDHAMLLKVTSPS